MQTELCKSEKQKDQELHPDLLCQSRLLDALVWATTGTPCPPPPFPRSHLDSVANVVIVSYFVSRDFSDLPVFNCFQPNWRDLYDLPFFLDHVRSLVRQNHAPVITRYRRKSRDLKAQQVQRSNEGHEQCILINIDNTAMEIASLLKVRDVRCSSE